MSKDLNQCNFIGRLGADPESRALPSGDAVCNFRIACGWKTKDKEGTEWVPAVAFGKLGEICERYLRRAAGCSSAAHSARANGKGRTVRIAIVLRLSSVTCRCLTASQRVISRQHSRDTSSRHRVRVQRPLRISTKIFRSRAHHAKKKADQGKG